MTALTRRQAVKTGAAIAAVGATATLALPAIAGGDDSELFAKNRELEAAKVEENDADDALGEAEGAAFKERGERPEDPDYVYNDETLKYEYQYPPAPEGLQEKLRVVMAELEANIPPELIARRNNYKLASVAYEKARERAEAKHGVEAAEGRQQEAMARRDAVEAELLMMPAATIAGMLIKARIAAGWVDDDGQPEHTAVLGLLADLERMAAA